jgi:hypothetical protein
MICFEIPEWAIEAVEMVAQCYYLLEAVFSGMLVILLLTQEQGSRWTVNPQLNDTVRGPYRAPAPRISEEEGHVRSSTTGR